MAATSELEKTICIVGAGAAGLITAHILLQDGFKNVRLITRDHTPGGVWSSERVYPGLTINNVHGEFRFSSLPMPPSSDPDGHLSGEDMRKYMQTFEDRYLKDRIMYSTEVVKITRCATLVKEKRWQIVVVRHLTGIQESIYCDKLIMCSGGCSKPNIPLALSPAAAEQAGFKGPVFHSTALRDRMDGLLQSVKPLTAAEPGHAVIIGGGKSAQDAATFLANQGRRVSIVFETTDATIAAPIPLPGFIRKSRFLPIISPYSVLRTRLERFLHGTWLGSKIVHGIWNALVFASYSALKVPFGSPLRNAQSLFWATRTNDEGVILPHRFFGLVAAGKIQLIAPARASHFHEDGYSIVLVDGRRIQADAVVLGTGWKSSWEGIIDDQTMKDIGMDARAPDPQSNAEVDRSMDQWKSLRDTYHPYGNKPGTPQRTAAIYRGIVPAKNIDNRDFAINGAIVEFSSNNGYTFEVAAHWIASYLRADSFLKLPPSPADAIRETELHNAWLMRRFLGMHDWANNSYSGDLVFFNWPQAVDTLLEDMSLHSMRSGGNWLTWPFKVIDLKEIEHLTEERAAKRIDYNVAN